MAETFQEFHGESLLNVALKKYRVFQNRISLKTVENLKSHVENYEPVRFEINKVKH